jgi:hypothetical protein
MWETRAKTQTAPRCLPRAVRRRRSAGQIVHHCGCWVHLRFWCNFAERVVPEHRGGGAAARSEAFPPLGVAAQRAATSVVCKDSSSFGTPRMAPSSAPLSASCSASLLVGPGAVALPTMVATMSSVRRSTTATFTEK